MPCWKATSSGFRYKDRNLTPDGLSKLVLKEGGAGKARILLRGKGSDLMIPTLPLTQDLTITVQLLNSDGFCWESQYSAPPLKSRTDQFKDKSD